MANNLRPWRSFTFFVSSTFIDMEDERDYLNNIIARELEREYEKKRVALNFIDLRWGIQTDKQASQEIRELSVLNVCMEEIKRSRPFFIALLGSRYGWIPSKERFTKMLESMEENEKQLLKEGDGASVTALEILFGALGNDTLLNRSLFYFRDSDSYTEMPEEERSLYTDPQHAEKLELLKKRIINKCRDKGLDNVHTYSLKWHNGGFSGLEEWGEQIKRDLRREIDAELEETSSSAANTWLEIEDLQQDIFIHAQTQLFVGRQEELARMERFALDRQGVMVLSGYATTGKSALLCQLYQRLQKKSELLVLLHCTGVSQYADYTYRMFCRLSARLCAELDMPYTEPENTGCKARNYFLDLVRKVSASGRKIVLLIDSTDSFRPSDDASNYSWLPDEACCILTCKRTHNDEYAKEITRYKRDAQILYLPFLQREEAHMLIREQCRLFHKSIPESVIELIMDKKADKQSIPQDYPQEYYAYSDPLWLKLMVLLLVSFDRNDFAKARQMTEETDEETKLEKFLCQCVQQAQIDPTNLIIKSFLPKLMQDVEFSFLYKLLMSIALSPGLNENDMSLLFNTEWDSLSFSKIRHYLKDVLVEDYETGGWHYRHVRIAETLISLLSEDNYRKFIHVLGNYYTHAGSNRPNAVRKALYFLINGNRQTRIAYLCSSPHLKDSDITEIAEEMVENIKLDEEKYLPWFISLFCRHQPDDQDIDEEMWKWMEQGGYQRLYRLAIEFLLPRLEWWRKSLALEFAQGIETVIKNFADNHPEDSTASNLLQELYNRIANCYEAMNQPELQKKYIITPTDTSIEGQAHLALNEGDYFKAEQLYLSIYHKNKQCHEAFPDNPQTVCAVFMSCMYLIDVYRRWNRQEHQEAIVKEAFTYLPSLPAESGYQKLKGQFYYMAGQLYSDQGYSQEAFGLLEESINILTASHEENLQDGENTIELGIAYETLGRYYEKQAQEEYALACYYKQAELFDEVLSTDSGNEICLHFRLLATCHQWDILQSQSETSEEWFDVNRNLVVLGKHISPDLLTENDLEHIASAYFFLGALWKEQPEQEREFSPQVMFDLLSEGWENLKKVYNFSYDSYYIELGLSCLYSRVEIAVGNNLPQEEPLNTLLQAYSTYPPSDSELGQLVNTQIQQMASILEKKQTTPLVRAFQNAQYAEAIRYYQDKAFHTDQEQLLYALCLLRSDLRKKAADTFASLRDKVQEDRNIWLLATLNLGVCYLLEGYLPEFKKLFDELTSEEKTLDKCVFLWNACTEKEALISANGPWYKRLFGKHPSTKELHVTLPQPHGWTEL